MRTFYLGVGAQKAGTTWLFKQIIKSDNFRRGFSKEYHLFDALYLNDGKSARANVSKRIKNYPFQEGEFFLEKYKNIMLSFYADKKNYYDYFDSILTDDDSFSSDITPSYSGLSSEVLFEIKEEFKRRDISLKIVFIMREPITRLESAIRMQMKRKKCLRELSSVDMTKKMFDSLNSTSDRSRSDYLYTCQQIDKVFSNDEVFYGFYETLFSQIEIVKLSSFFNMRPHEFDASNIVNSTIKPFKYSLQDVNDFQTSVTDRYQFVLDRFDFDLSVWNEAVYNMVDEMS
ncbi:hypothetical protein [Amphritea sp. HPY]|uniref:hypothetical protein n=1 Tax=Amphritea sp. HPY TaxID=3421652 RepID=UPI003D7D3156